MSYDIYLLDPVTNERIEFDFYHHCTGGTYQVGGTNKAWLNITWNYAKYYYQYFGEKGIRTIYGMTGAESIPLLQSAIKKLGNGTNPDYWTATEGNAKAPLLQLVAFAQMRPDGVWDGD